MKVKRVIEILEENGWAIDRIVGSHRQYKKKDNPFVLTVAEALRDELIEAHWRKFVVLVGLMK